MSRYSEIHARREELRRELQLAEREMQRLQNRRPVNVAEERTMIDMQARADAVYEEFGRRAPPPDVGELPGEFRLRLLAGLQPHSPTWKNRDLCGMEEAGGLDEVERQVFAEARKDARCPSDLKRGEIREIARVDDATGHRRVDFVGDTSFVAQFPFAGRPRYAKFHTRATYEQMAHDALMASMTPRPAFRPKQSAAPPPGIGERIGVALRSVAR